jgi:L-ascorbate metabolism protein UlaG (beta-lactamase superfamily)
MRVTKCGHACVRVEHRGATIVIDPGVFTEAAAFDGANAVLLTHEHADHFDPVRLRVAAEENTGLQIWSTADVAAALGDLGSRVHAVGAGDSVTVAGLEVEVHGEWHEVIHPDIPRVRNVGFLLGGAVFHPGDAFTLPGRPVDTVLLPVHAPWSKIQEVVDYVREVAPSHALTVHDSLLNDTGRSLVTRLLSGSGLLPEGLYEVFPVGESREFPDAGQSR